MYATDITPDSNHATVERLWGFSFREDAAAAAVINIRRASDTGQILFTVPLAASAGATLVLPKPMSVEGGVYVEEVSGSITGVLLRD